VFRKKRKTPIEPGEGGSKGWFWQQGVGGTFLQKKKPAVRKKKNPSFFVLEDGQKGRGQGAPRPREEEGARIEPFEKGKIKKKNFREWGEKLRNQERKVSEKARPSGKKGVKGPKERSPPRTRSFYGGRRKKNDPQEGGGTPLSQKRHPSKSPGPSSKKEEGRKKERGVKVSPGEKNVLRLKKRKGAPRL